MVYGIHTVPRGVTIPKKTIWYVGRGVFTMVHGIPWYLVSWYYNTPKPWSTSTVYYEKHSRGQLPLLPPLRLCLWKQQQKQQNVTQMSDVVGCANNGTSWCNDVTPIIPSLFQSRLETYLLCKSFFFTVAFLFFFRTDSIDSPDCLPILLSISVFAF